MAATRPGPDTTPRPGPDPAARDRTVAPIVPPLRRQRPAQPGQQQPVEQFPLGRLLAGVAFAGSLALYGAMAATGRPVGVGLVLAPVIAVLFFPLVSHLAKQDTTFDLIGIAYLGLALRFVGAYFRYSNAADAIEYHEVGVELAESFRRFDFGVDTGRNIPGTGSIRWLSGLVSVFSGDSMFAKFLVFTAISFAGALLFYRAFALAVPDGGRRRYALLIFLWPAMAFWPSSLGKEAALMFTIGLTSYGAARLYTRKRGGLTLLALGILGSTMVRPHVALMLLITVFIAYLFVGGTGTSKPFVVSKIVMITVLLAAGAVLATTTADFLGLEDISTESINEVQEGTQAQTTQGGGQFSSVEVDNPARYPAAFVTVLFRPFPFETHNTESVLSSIEGFVLIVLMLLSLPRLVRLPRLLFQNAYIAYALSTVLLFCYIFSVIANFGILARQRVQVLPMVFVLLALPSLARSEPTERQPRQPLAVGARATDK